MLFNSYTFLLFFAVVMALHHAPLPWGVKKFNLLTASYLFYAAWNAPFVLLLWLSTVTDWFVARWLYAATTPKTRRRLLLLSLMVNLGLLGFFKYSLFLLDNLVTALQLIGIHYHPAPPDIILPLGISFYTFQTLSYTLDVYRGRLKPWPSFLDYALYVTFFPQLVAGPIVRAADFLPQLLAASRPAAHHIGWGLSLLTLGLFEKVVLADAVLAPMVESVYDTGNAAGTLAAWTGTLAFAGQIFCDFAGYSTAAIGAAMCLGFKLPDNFRFPYAAVGFSDFWRRWHISLSSWLRDYLYIPLGGNRQGSIRTQIHLMLTMLLGGLWHGAAWTFVIWGALHGFYLVAERGLRRWLGHWAVWRTPPAQLGLALITFALVCFAWVFFRAESFGQAYGLISAMLGLPPEHGELTLPRGQLITTYGTVGSLLAVHWLMRNRSLESVASITPTWVRAAVLATLMVGIVSLAGEDRAFIYFQF